MDISIIIPCHNIENYITPLCVSLNMQNLYDYSAELIFLTDNCTDKTQLRINNFPWDSEKYRVYIVSGNFGSCGAARNEGLARATGDYIWFVDGDDWLTSVDAVANIVNAFKSTDFHVIKFNFSAPPQYPSLQDRTMMVWQYAYRKEVIGETRFPNTQPDEDFVFNKEIFSKEGITLGQLNLSLYYYNFMREGSNMFQYYTTGRVEQ